MADITETVPFNFDELYAGLQAKFEDAGYDIEEGSNTSQLITAMSYLTSMLNVNTAVNINETLLPLATKRNNALQDARALGYEISHKQSYYYTLTLSLTAGDHVIPKYTEFTADGKTFYYVGDRLEYTGVSEGYEITIEVKEGTLYKSENHTDVLKYIIGTTTDADGNDVIDYYVDVPYVDVEENGLEVFLTYYDELGNLNNKEEWSRSSKFMIDKDTILDKEYVRIDNIDFRTPRIYFSISGIGEELRVGTIVEVNALTSSGVDGEITGFTAMTDAEKANSFSTTLSGITVSGAALSVQGTDEESIESIQLNAPMFYNSANRAITADDYVAICNRHQAVNTSVVWGGDDEYPKCPGFVWFSFSPSTNVRDYDANTYKTEFILVDSEDLVNWYVEDNEIRSTEYDINGELETPGVWDVLDNYKIPTLEFLNRHPIYLDFDYSLNLLKYNIKTSKADIHQEVFDVINNTFTGTDDSLHLEQFGTEYFHSNIEKRIDLNITDITGFNNSVETNLMITSKNISSENSDLSLNDLYVPLAIPYEDYFDNNGYLITNALPSIDTENFISEKNMDIWTDFSSISDKAVSSDSIIVAPVRAKQTETVVNNSGTVGGIVLSTIKVYPDFNDAEEETFDLVKVYKNGTQLEIDTDFTIGNAQTILFTDNLIDGDEIAVESNNHIGYYHLFNGYRKAIIVQFFIDNRNGADVDSSGLSYTEPKSYLTTKDGFYGYTNDTYYITTEGFTVSDESELNAYTGKIIRAVTTDLYYNSVLTTEDFDTVRYMAFNYLSPNFKVSQNVIPRLKSITFA